MNDVGPELMSSKDLKHPPGAVSEALLRQASQSPGYEMRFPPPFLKTLQLQRANGLALLFKLNKACTKVRLSHR